MKRLSLKATSLILALVLALSLSVTAFADDNAASMTRAEVTQEVIKNMGLAAQAEPQGLAQLVSHAGAG